MTDKSNGNELVSQPGGSKTDWDIWESCFRKIPDLFATISPEGMILFANEAWSKMLSLPVSLLRNKSFFDFVHPDDLDKARQKLILCFEENQLFISELRIKSHGGNYKWIEWKGEIDIETKCLFVIGRDFTERKEKEDNLLIREERYRLLAEHARDVIWTMELDGTITYISPAVEELRGFTVKEAMHQPLNQIITPESQAIVIAYMQRLNAAYSTGKELEDFKCENEYYCKDGTTLWTEVFVHPYFAATSNVPSILGVTRDISERKQFETRLLQQTNDLRNAIATRDKFFSIIAHDLRSPFNGFISLLQYLEESILGLSLLEIQKYIKIIGVSAGNLYMLLENLLEWSRIQTGTFSTNSTNFYLNERILASCELFSEALSKKSQEIEVNIPEKLPLLADKRMVDGIIRNLVTNAMKFSPKGSKISISAKMNDRSMVEVSIRDVGIGMSENILGNLFKLNSNICLKGTEGEPSSGLGLILVKEFVSLMGGEIWAESEIGKGSVFHFTLPAFLSSTDEPSI